MKLTPDLQLISKEPAMTTPIPTSSVASTASTAASTVAANTPIPALGKAQGPLALAIGKDQLMHLNTGYPNKFKAQAGLKYKVVQDQASKAEKNAADNVIATQQGDDLLLRYEDGTTVQLEGFYVACKGASGCSVTLAGDTAEGYTLSGDSLRGAPVGEGTALVYAHGSNTVLMDMAQGQSALSSTLLALGEAPIATYLPASSTGYAMAGADAGFDPSLVLGILGGGGALAAIGAGGASSAAVIPSVVIPSTTISGLIVAGSVVAGNGLTVSAFKADGTLLASGAMVDATGHYQISYTTVYSGAVLLKVVDSTGGVDYFDEATSAGKDLNSSLYAVVSVSGVGQSISANITPLTDFAAKKIGLTLDSISGISSDQNVANVNIAIAQFFGLTTGTDQIISLLPTPVVDSNGNPLIANLYGKMLAVISGAELQNGQTTDAVLNTLASGIVTSNTNTNAAFDGLTTGSNAMALLQGGVSRALQSGVITLANAEEVLSTLLPSSSTTTPYISIFADKVYFKAGDTGNIYFKLSAVSANFAGSDITVVGGTLGALIQNTTDPTLYSAVFTPAASQVLSAGAAISVAASTFTNGSGTANTASSPLMLAGDTVVPTLIITDNQPGLANGDITYTFTFSEAVTGFAATDVVVGNGTQGAFTAVSATSYTLVVHPTANFQGNVTVNVAASAAQDAAGNNSTAAVQSVQAVDTRAPTVTITDNQPGLTNGDITYTFTFSEAVTGFAATDVVVANGTQGTFTAVSATSYTLVVHPTANYQGNVTVDVAASAAQDAAGNNSTAAVQSVQAVDTSAPTVTNAGVIDGLTNVEVTSNIVLTFGSTVAAVMGGHITLVNDANTVASAGYQGESVDHSINLYMGSSTTNAGVTTVQTYQDAGMTIASGTLSIAVATGVVTIIPLYNLDLANNYHLEISAGSFTKTSNGMSNAAYGALNGSDYALNFSTVSPGLATASGNLTAAVASVQMDASGTTMNAGKAWVSIDVPGLGSPGTYQNIDLSAKNYALVIKNASTAPGELALTNNVYFALSSFTAGNTLYFDDQNNAGHIDFESNAAPQPSGYNGSLAYDMYTTATTGRGYVASVAFNGTAFDAALTAAGGHVVIG